MSSNGDRPVLPATLGGQAVVEGVMIRGPRGAAICVRKPDGGLAFRTERNEGAGRLRGVPVLRGIAALGETVTQGMRALVWSTQVATGSDPEEPSNAQIRLTSAMSMAAMMAVFLLGPAVASRRLEHMSNKSRFATAAEGLVRIGTLIGYLRVIGRVPQAQRLFAYHGAEHRAIQAYEAGDALETTSLERYPNAHVRCGTSFLLTTAVLSSVVYAILGPMPLRQRLLSRIALTPIIAGLSYEAIRLAGASSSPAWQLLFQPNLRLQALTTRDPDEDQMEVAIEAVRAAVALHTDA
jgi:uncharacterized protein YqhQ